MKILLLLPWLLWSPIQADDCTDCAKTGQVNTFLNALEGIRNATPGLTKIEGMSICRINSDSNPLDGGWGHWWIELSENESYGWWAVENFGNDIGFEKLKKVFRGVPGELNGQTIYGGSPTRDPKHGDRTVGSQIFDVYISKNQSPDEVISNIRTFAQNYKGGWSWPKGPNCRSFQKEIIRKFGLVIKRRAE